ncbi:MAG TPA: type II toxin-antitoxin system HicB family antitoxin [Burkholderiales bacterium]|nr:type II toxin-antitoxin system HicB family antitoxin [Burkholderiales bacterium]
MAKITFKMTVPAEVHQEGAWFYSSCPLLDVHSQGRSEKEALHNLIEALQVFIETCYDAGTLDQVLRERGFETDHENVKIPAGQRAVDVPFALIARRHAEAHAR